MSAFSPLTVSSSVRWCTCMHVCMKHVYRPYIPFKHNLERVKDQLFQHVQVSVHSQTLSVLIVHSEILYYIELHYLRWNLLQSDVNTLHSISLSYCSYIYFYAKRTFTLTTRRRRGQKVIGQWAIVEVPGRHGSNVTHYAEINNQVVTVLSPWGHITPNAF